MKKLYNEIQQIIKIAFFKYDYKLPSDIDWKALSIELKQHSMFYLPADQVFDFGLTEKEKKEYVEALMKQVATWNVVMYEQQAIVDRFHELHIPMVILKGCTSAMYYPMPEYRTMGDIDLIVNPRDFKCARIALEDMGYSRRTFNEDREILLENHGIKVELHTRFSVMNDRKHAQYLDALIYQCISHPEQGSIYNYSFPMLPKLERGLVLLTHISQHMEIGLGMRQILDWMVYVNAEIDDNYWSCVFEKEAENIGLKKLAIVTTRMCQMYLGLSDTITWCQNADLVLCEELMTYIMDNGNFGAKDITSRKTISVLRIMRNPWGFMISLQKNGCKKWKWLIKYPWLKPFAWLYQLIRLIRSGLYRKHILRNMIKDMKKARREDVLLDNLEVVRRYRGLNKKKGRH